LEDDSSSQLTLFLKEHVMKRQSLNSTAVALMSASVLVLSSCTTEQQGRQTAAYPQYQASATTQPGVAGGVYEDAITAQAIITAIDVPSRRVTLTGPEGRQLTFTAGPEIKNLPQMRVGDKVTATFAQRLVVTVRSDDAAPRLANFATQATALKGEKPGMLVAEETESVARVTAIDSTNRTANLQFSDGVVNNVPVRPDVELSRYKVGDNVVIRLTTALTVLVARP
jgi:hypothetical protein